MVFTKEYVRSTLDRFFEKLKIWEMEEMDPSHPLYLYRDTRLPLEIPWKIPTVRSSSHRRTWGTEHRAK